MVSGLGQRYTGHGARLKTRKNPQNKSWVTPTEMKTFRCNTDVCDSEAHVTVKKFGITMFDVGVKDLAARLCPLTCGTSGNENNTQIDGVNTDKLCQHITKGKSADDHVFRLCRYDP